MINFIFYILVLLISEIGVGLAGMGIGFIFLGVLLLFDKGLLAIGNVTISYLLFFFTVQKLLTAFVFIQLLFLSGLGFLIGMEKTFFFFFQRHKVKGTTCFFVGIATVFIGWPLIGMILEFYGSVLLFGYDDKNL